MKYILESNLLLIITIINVTV